MITLEQTTKAQRRARVYLSSLTSAIDEVDGQRHAPAAVPRGKGPGIQYTGG
jgi:hypothetical protein